MNCIKINAIVKNSLTAITLNKYMIRIRNSGSGDKPYHQLFKLNLQVLVSRDVISVNLNIYSNLP